MRQVWLQLLSISILIALAGCTTPPAPPQTTSSPTVPATAPTPSATPTDGQLVGKPLNGGGTPVYRLMPDGTIRHLADWLTFISYGYLPQDVINVTPERLKTFTLGAPLTRWVTGVEDHGLYLLYYGKRYVIPDAEALAETGGSPQDVSQLPDDILAAYPLAEGFPAYFLPPDSSPHPTAAAWYNKSLWVGDSAGGISRWDGNRYVDRDPLSGDFSGAAVSGISADRETLVIRFDSGPTLQQRGGKLSPVASLPDWIGRLVVPASQPPSVWLAGVSAYDLADASYHVGNGLWLFNPAEHGDPLTFPSRSYNPPGDGKIDPSAYIKALLPDQSRGTVWAGTAGDGLLSFDGKSGTSRHWTSFDSDLPDNTINGLALAANGDLWMATSQGVVLRHGKAFSLALDRGGDSVAVASSGDVWAAGSNLIARVGPDGSAETFTPFDAPQFLDTFRFVVLDDAGMPWFVGYKRLIHFNGQSWVSFDVATHQKASFEPQAGMTQTAEAFPDPTADYQTWLQTWPRPAEDNGRCIHYLQLPSGDDFEARQQITRMQALDMRWVLVNYNGPSQLTELAPIFQQAGIMGVWRPHVRPDEPYTRQWARDVQFLRSSGIPPYIQIYNEPSLDQEWDGKPVDQATYLANLGPAVAEVYQAGGYVGLQQIDPDWLRVSLRRLKADGLAYTFDRLFFVPHPYGFNHPPDYVEDANGVLGFREYAQVFRDEIGFVPPMIAGEGGWRPGEAQDARFPKIGAALHRDYILAVLGWFSSGRLSDGEPLPDYLFAYCPWLLSDPVDPAAWFDSRSGDLTLTTQAVTDSPGYRRRFSWDTLH